jgi:hypothetical protein
MCPLRLTSHGHAAPFLLDAAARGIDTQLTNNKVTEGRQTPLRQLWNLAVRRGRA